MRHDLLLTGLLLLPFLATAALPLDAGVARVELSTEEPLPVSTPLGPLPHVIDVPYLVDEAGDVVEGDLGVQGLLLLGADLQCAACIHAADIAFAAVGPAALAPAAVGTAALADGAVTGPKLAPGSVGHAALADGSVDYAKLAPSVLRPFTLMAGAFAHELTGPGHWVAHPYAQADSVPGMEQAGKDALARRAGTLKALAVSVDQNGTLQPGESVEVAVVVNGVPTGLSVRFDAGTPTGTMLSVGATHPVEAGDKVHVRVTSSVPPLCCFQKRAITVAWSFELEAR